MSKTFQRPRNQKSSASAATRKKHARKAAGDAKQELPLPKEKKKETEKAMEELEAAFAKARKLQDEWGLSKGLMGYWEEKGDWDTRKVESVMSELERKSKK